MLDDQPRHQVEEACQMQAGDNQHHREQQYQGGEINACDGRGRRQNADGKHGNRANHRHRGSVDQRARQAANGEDQVAGEEDRPRRDDMPMREGVLYLVHKVARLANKGPRESIQLHYNKLNVEVGAGLLLVETGGRIPPRGDSVLRFTCPLLLVGFAVAIAGTASSQNQSVDESARETSGNANSAMPTYFIEATDDGRRLTIPRGRILIVRLEANPSTGYSWSVVGEPAPLMFVSSEYESDPQIQPRPGGSQIQVLRFKSDLVGTGELKLGYRRPWEKNVAPAKTFEIHVTVTHFSIRVHEW